MTLFPSDETLMQATADGDLAAFEQLVVRHQQSVWRTAYRMLGCQDEAEDVAQQAFLRILEARERYRPQATFRTYIYRIVVRLCLDHLRKNRPALAEHLLPVDDRTSSQQQMADKEQARAVQQAVAGLPAKQRSAVVLRYYEGLSGREIAAAMDTTHKAIERRLARARETLRKRLGDYFLD